MILKGWIEKDGIILKNSEIEEMSADEISRCGGEFYLKTDDFSARDVYGIYPADSSEEYIKMNPKFEEMPLTDAIVKAVELRAVKGSVSALSGGVDSSLVSVLSGLPAVCIGTENSNDIQESQKTADALGLNLTADIITDDEIEDALDSVLDVIPEKNPMDLEIALSVYFISRLAEKCGAQRVVTGQAADELFGGYARYSQSLNLRSDLDKDFEGLVRQRARDFAASSLCNVWFSMPYMDVRVVSASRKFADCELVSESERKIALRRSAEKYLPKEIARKPKKAMQYGSGISKALSRIAKSRGLKNTAGLIEDYFKNKMEE